MGRPYTVKTRHVQPPFAANAVMLGEKRGDERLRHDRLPSQPVVERVT